MFAEVAEAVAEIRAGRMVVVVDDEDRENEGDLTLAAEFVTPEAINFMAKYGRGLICLTLTEERADYLRLGPMTQENTSRFGTAFTESIEAREGVTTGISAADRAHTIKVAIDPKSTAQDLARPGHVFPLRARKGGVLVRAGQTEASVDLARLAGQIPAGVICEVMKDDGTMARLPDLVQFSQLHGLKIGTIADLIAYRRKYDHFVTRVTEAPFRSHNGGEWKMIVYANTLEYAEHIALVKGDIRSGGPVLVRMHALNIFSDLLGYQPFERDVLGESMRIVAEEGRGVVVVLRQTKPTFVSDIITGRTSEDVDRRRVKEYGVGAQILLDLGVRDMTLLTDTPEKKIVALDGYGLNVVGTHSIRKSGG